MHDNDIRQRDLTGKSVEEMTREERREMKRRFEEFLTAVGKAPPRKAPKPKVRRWNPAASTHG